MKKVVVLGASGSIGKNTLHVIKNHSRDFRVACLSVHTNIHYLIEQSVLFKPEIVVVTGSNPHRKQLKQLEAEGIQVVYGKENLTDAISSCDFDVLVNALVGSAGLLPTLTAIDRGKTVALANKETLVMAGELVMKKARQKGVQIIPIDSEHSAIFQCLAGENVYDVNRIILTGSGGPFLHRKMNEFDEITVEEALDHPKWKMGDKITIDSATLMNKGLEIIEAYWMFGLPLEKIDLVIHPQSIIHSLVEFVDGSIKAQLGWPDMKVPIQYALSYPHRYPAKFKQLDFAKLHELTFYRPDFNKFPNLRLALQAIKIGGTATAVLNAANETAVQLFLEAKIRFITIPKLIEQALSQHKTVKHPELQQILQADQWSRSYVQGLVSKKKIQ